MSFALIAAVLASAATGYLIGHAIIAPKDSFLRTKVGVYMLVGLGLTFLTLPLQMTGLDAFTGALGGQIPDAIVNAFALPEGFSSGLYLTLWIVLTLAGLLVGMRIWNARDPGWRPAAQRAVEPAAERARGLLPLANSLNDVLLTLGKAPLSPRDIEFLKPQLLLAGARFSAQLPKTRTEAFNLVAKHVPASVAVRVAELLQQGAAEKEAAG